MALILVPGAVVSAQGQTTDAFPERVIVKLRSPLRAQMLSEDGLPPTLTELGYQAIEVPEGMTAQDFAAELEQLPFVDSAQPDVRVIAAVVPNDPFYGPSQASYLNSIGAPAGWDIETGGSDVIVAVVDSGTDLTHPEFAGRLWQNSDETLGDGLDNDFNGCIDDRFGCRYVTLDSNNALGCGYTNSTRTGAVADDHGQGSPSSHSHGTSVAGAMAAAGNNAQGISGIAWGVRIMTLKALDCGPFGSEPGGSMFDVSQAVDYAVQNGATVINLSLGTQNAVLGDIQAMRDVILTAKSAGAIIVAAAGNENGSVGYPAAYAAEAQFSNVVAVAATNNTAGNVRASFSNFGPAISVAAPGINIAGTTRLAMPGGGYGSASGTSFSAPLTAGLLALMRSRAPHLNYLEIITIMKAAASPAPSPNNPPNWAGAGIINIGAALARIPFDLSGAALHDWKDVPAGSTVQALVGSTVCGEATVTSNGLVSTYAMRIKSDPELAGCGALGRTVEVYLSSPEGTGLSQPQVPWPAQNEDMAVTEDVSTVSPGWGSIVTQSLGPGWNVVTHLNVGGTLPGSFSYLPGSWTQAYAYDPEAPNGLGGVGRYLRYGKDIPAYVNEWMTIDRFDVYWVDASNANVTMINPCQAACPRMVDLGPGWNAFVFTGSTTKLSTFLQPLAGNYQQVLTRDNGAEEWLSHIPGFPRFQNDFEALHEMRIYWIFLEEAATLELP